MAAGKILAVSVKIFRDQFGLAQLGKIQTMVVIFLLQAADMERGDINEDAIQIRMVPSNGMGSV